MRVRLLNRGFGEADEPESSETFVDTGRRADELGGRFLRFEDMISSA